MGRAFFVIVFVVALPFAIALANLRWFVSDPGNLLPIQLNNRVSELTGLTPNELLSIDRATILYFQGDRTSIGTALTTAGVLRSPYSDRDNAHWLDVHDMIGTSLTIQWIASAYVLVFLAATVLGRLPRLAARGAMTGGILTFAALALIGLISLVDWDAFFLGFHLVSFGNDLWQLDPARDAMIRLYPPGFFMNSAIQLATMSVLEAIIVTVVAAAYLRSSKSLSKAKS